MNKLITLVALSVLLTGCVRSGANDVSVKAEQLVNHRFVLETANGQAVEPGEQPADIHFDGEMKISGGMCNRFTGQGKLSEGKLTVKNMAMTRMMCTDAQRNALDNVLATMLNTGAQVDLTDSQLTLTTADQTLIYKQTEPAQ
ncbi:heat shock protein HslJ [Yokenella regensburgei]|uniref:heat shock protein HslJ n=1 Tax=Yokenella regensburgei TaxID=158877 RepID=UPI003F13FE17